MSLIHNISNSAARDADRKTALAYVGELGRQSGKGKNALPMLGIYCCEQAQMGTFEPEDNKLIYEDYLTNESKKKDHEAGGKAANASKLKNFLIPNEPTDACPMNIVGSKITAAGKQTRACSDLKRVAVVPALNIENEALGGPMLLNIPAASLGEAASFSQKMAQMGYPLHSVAVRISFDINENYPKFVFSPSVR